MVLVLLIAMSRAVQGKDNPAAIDEVMLARFCLQHKTLH